MLLNMEITLGCLSTSYRMPDVFFDWWKETSIGRFDWEIRGYGDTMFELGGVSFQESSSSFIRGLETLFLATFFYMIFYLLYSFFCHHHFVDCHVIDKCRQIG